MSLIEEASAGKAVDGAKNAESEKVNRKGHMKKRSLWKRKIHGGHERSGQLLRYLSNILINQLTNLWAYTMIGPESKKGELL